MTPELQNALLEIVEKLKNLEDTKFLRKMKNKNLSNLELIYTPIPTINYCTCKSTP